MQIVKYYLIAGALFFVFQAKAQNITNDEISRIANILFEKLNADTAAIKNLEVKRFKFNNDTSASELGDYLTRQIVLNLDKPNRRFAIIDRSKIKDLFKEVKFNESGLTDGRGPQLGHLRSIHLQLEGVMQSKGNYIELTLNAVELQTGTAAHTAQGFITITPSIQKMLKPNNTKKGKPTEPVKPSPGFYGVYRKDDLKFELTRCEKKGRYVECEMNITNEGRNDVHLYVYQGHSRIINQNMGIEYFISNLKLAEKSHSEQAEKTIVAQGSIRGLFTFENVIDTISTISKLELHCWSAASGHFTLDIRDIPVTIK